VLWSPAPRHRLALPVVHTFGLEMCSLNRGAFTAPSSGTWTTANLALFYPITLLDPFVVSKAYWVNGATVGTNNIDFGVYQMTNSSGRCDLIRSTGETLSAGTASAVQEAGTFHIAAANITSPAGDSTDSTTYTTASITLKAGRLYLMSVVNTAASAGAISSIDNSGTWTSRSSTQFNGTAHRVSIWSYAPTVDYTGTLVINFGANTQTSATWSLNEFAGVDTTTNDGVVQQAVGTGNSTTPLATLAAFGSAANATFGALGNVSDTTTTPGTNFRELSDTSSATPVGCLQTEWQVGNDTTVDGTITSAQWGACGIEIKASTAPFVIPASTPSNPSIYVAMSINGTTATVLRAADSRQSASAAGVLELTSTFPLPSTCTPVALTAARNRVLAGFSSRSLIG
jgi:hypothetical protein